MQEVDCLPVDLSGELREVVEAGFTNVPVVVRPPVGDQIGEVRLANAVGPADVRKFVRPASPVQPVMEIRSFEELSRR
jgi:hypothetical protein